MTILAIEFPSQHFKKDLTQHDSVKESLCFELSACRRYLLLERLGVL